jgi:hypothetical protein
MEMAATAHLTLVAPDNEKFTVPWTEHQIAVRVHIGTRHAIHQGWLVERAGKATGFDMKIHPHMLRHACGFKLANDGVDTRTIQAYLGHKSIQHTVRYTELAPTRFKSLFRDWLRHVLDLKSKKGTRRFQAQKRRSTSVIRVPSEERCVKSIPPLKIPESLLKFFSLLPPVPAPARRALH